MPGWRVIALHDKVYPGLVRDTIAVATGDLLWDLTLPEWFVLDAFENLAYDLVAVHTDGESRPAWAYGLGDRHDGQSWSMQVFADEKLPEYLARCRRWRRQHERLAK